MRRVMLLAAAALALAGPALAESPAERASRSLERDVARDRLRDAAESAREGAGAPAPTLPAQGGARQIEEDRANLRPDVGRPEQQGRPPGAQRDAGEDRDVTR